MLVSQSDTGHPAANPAAIMNNSKGGTNSEAVAGARTSGATAKDTPISSAAIAAQRDADVAGSAEAMGERGVAGVSTAHILARAGRAEMRVQFEADGLGPVELRAAAAGNTIGATIITDRPETHGLLANGVGTLRQVLTDHNVQVERIDIVLNSAGNGGRMDDGGTSSGRGGSHANEQGAARPWAGNASADPRTPAGDEAVTTSSASLYREGRLSVRV